LSLQKYIYIQGGPETGLFLKACDFRICWCRNAFYILNYSVFTLPQQGSGVLWSVCLYVCLSVRRHISGTAEPIVAIFCADPQWPWHIPPLAALRYIMYFQFYGWCHIWL